VITNVFKACFSICVIGALNSPVATPEHGLLGLSPGLRLGFISENASLFCMFVSPPTVLLHLVVSSASFLWALSLFIYLRSMSGLLLSCCNLAGDLNKTILFAVGVPRLLSLTLDAGSSVRARAALCN